MTRARYRIIYAQLRSGRGPGTTRDSQTYSTYKLHHLASSYQTLLLFFWLFFWYFLVFFGIFWFFFSRPPRRFSFWIPIAIIMLCKVYSVPQFAAQKNM